MQSVCCSEGDVGVDDAGRRRRRGAHHRALWKCSRERFATELTQSKQKIERGWRETDKGGEGLPCVGWDQHKGARLCVVKRVIAFDLLSSPVRGR